MEEAGVLGRQSVKSSSVKQILLTFAKPLGLGVRAIYGVIRKTHDTFTRLKGFCLLFNRKERQAGGGVVVVESCCQSLGLAVESSCVAITCCGSRCFPHVASLDVRP